ncbi:MAG: NADH:ubiquinone oxidoreductase subunit NDUFA12 [Hyphomicrobium sp.]|jgi:NADH:ubiquinone oxidoreductase subunit
MSMLTEIFSWWGGNTWGTRLFTWRKGRLVGGDDFGNRYYVQKSGIGPLGVPARWVIYPNLSEASQVPPEWHGWLHHTVDTPPTEDTYRAHPWEKPHQANLTGTAGAYRPKGSILGDGDRQPSSGDYKPWKPN